MKILSLFDGMACGYIAFKNLGIEIDEYNAQRENEAWSDYMNFPTETARDVAEAWSRRSQKYAENNAELLDDDNVKAGNGNVLELLGDAMGIAFDGIADLGNMVQGKEVSEDSQRLYDAFGGGARLL